jgi:pimeloyl-ACP methyl ester carboxylesterase
MIDFQSHLIFPAHAVPRAGPLPPQAERLTVSAPDAKLEGVLIPAHSPKSDGALILGFGGNGWNGQDVAEYLHGVFPDDDIVVFHYRGYAPSTGSPTGEALIADAPLVYDEAVKRVPSRRVIAVGFSIGTGVAAQLSARRDLDGLILVTPFDSLKAVAQSMYPWLPIGPFFQHEIDAAAPLKHGKVPVAILAADHDELVPTSRTDALRAVAANIVFDRTIRNAGHNSIYGRSDFQDAMRSARDAVLDPAHCDGTG